MMRIAFLAFCALMWAAPVRAQEARVLDAFDSVSAWQAGASDGVSAVVSAGAGRQGNALKLDFDFHSVSGYAFARRALPLTYPENFELTFWLRADVPANTLEFKLIDASGENVWWQVHSDYAFPHEWTRIRIPLRKISFAWGPAADHNLRQTASIEFVVSRGSGGGAGSVYIDDLQMRALPPAGGPFPEARASASTRSATAALAIDNDLSTAWRAPVGARQFTIDYGVQREFGGLDLNWAEGAAATDYDVSLSDDGRTWTVSRRIVRGDGGRDALLMTESAARYVRLELRRGQGRTYALRDVQLKPPEWGADRNTYITTLAHEAPRGVFPRAFLEQSYWTLLGADGAADSALISEDGAIEVGKGGFSIEPFIRVAGRTFTWADVSAAPSLLDNDLPIPAVTWSGEGWGLKTTAFVDGDAANSVLIARYDVTNTSAAPQTIDLMLGVRPFQVNGPEQMLNVKGGVARIDHIAVAANGVAVDGRPRIASLVAASAFAASAFDTGLLPLQIAERPSREARDEEGLASGVLTYTLRLKPGETRTVAWSTPLTGAPAPAALSELAAREARVAANWRARLDRVDIRVPAEGQVIVDTIRTSLAHILMSRHGPVLQPGTRAYNRSWIRDGAMMADQLIRLGSPDIATDYLRWYAPHQFENGKAPCCVDARGSDPVLENDSHGEFIFLVADVWRATHDRALLREMWPRVDAAVRYMDESRASEMAKNATPERRHLYGLMPPSISHEGYMSRPAYSYWDDFWALLGYKEAVELANALGEREAARRIAASRDAFRRDLAASIASMNYVHHVDFIPGAADRGDFDPTSTTIAFTPTDEADRLPQGALEKTFERYWRVIQARRDGSTQWEDYTPYEIRNVGAFVRLGWRDRASQLLAYFFADRRPQQWNGWAEVVGRDARKRRFIGDMPHAWISSDYIRSALDMFAYSRERDRSMVLAAGLPVRWFDGDGVSVRDLRTPYGVLAYSIKREANALVIDVAGDVPPGGFVVPWPYDDRAPGRATQDGHSMSFHARELVINRPGRVIVSMR